MLEMLYESEGGWFLQKDRKLEPRKSRSGLKTESVLVLSEGGIIHEQTDDRVGLLKCLLSLGMAVLVGMEQNSVSSEFPLQLFLSE